MITVWIMALFMNGKIVIVTDAPVERVYRDYLECVKDIPMATQIMEMPVICVPQLRKVS